MDRETFRQLKAGQELRDRDGRIWKVTGSAWEEGGLTRIAIRSGDHVRREDERSRDIYLLVD